MLGCCDRMKQHCPGALCIPLLHYCCTSCLQLILVMKTNNTNHNTAAHLSIIHLIMLIVVCPANSCNRLPLKWCSRRTTKLSLSCLIEKTFEASDFKGQKSIDPISLLCTTSTVASQLLQLFKKADELMRQLAWQWHARAAITLNKEPLMKNVSFQVGLPGYQTPELFTVTASKLCYLLFSDTGCTFSGSPEPSVMGSIVQQRLVFGGRTAPGNLHLGWQINACYFCPDPTIFYSQKVLARFGCLFFFSLF